LPQAIAVVTFKPPCMVPQRILLIRWKSIGDVVFTLPAANRLREVFPEAEIVFLSSTENAFILEGFQAINHVWTLDRQQLRSRHAVRGVFRLVSLLFQIRRYRFSMAVDLQNYGESALIARWSGAPMRLGYHKKAIRRAAYTHSQPPTHDLHPALEHLRLLDHAGILGGPIRNEWILRKEQATAAAQFLDERRMDPRRPLVYLQPFTSSPHKNWPLSNHIALADALTQSGIQILFGGGPEDRRRLREAGVSSDRIIDVPRQTELALVRASHLVVGGDTGFIHIANALGCRVLLLGRPSAVPPLTQPGSMLVAPDDSMTSIPFETVLQRVRSILREIPFHCP
jgi:ADP-heptose:LPS heptosyltransferase